MSIFRIVAPILGFLLGALLLSLAIVHPQPLSF
jgi:hypothetical protein